MKFSRKIFFTTFLIIMLSFGAGGFVLINTVFASELNSSLDSAESTNRYVTAALSLYCESGESRNNLMNKAVSFAEKIASDSGEKAAIGDIDELYFYDEDSFINGMETNARGSRLIYENGKHYIQTVSKINLLDSNCYIETLADISGVYENRDIYCRVYRIILLGVALLASLLLLFFSRLLTRPLEKLTQASKQIADGDFGMRVKQSRGISSSTEIKELSSSFNVMAEHVQKNIAKLEQTAKSREDFVASFTHELKTPLTSVIGCADMLRTYELPPGERRDCAEMIYREAKRLEGLSVNLLNIFVLRKSKINKVHFSSARIAEECAESVKFILKRYGVTLVKNAEEKSVLCEPELVKTLLYNLIDNACKSSKTGDEIWLEGFCENGRYVFAVNDEGCGIPKEELYKITEPFYMVDKSRSRRLGGAGLGLALCSEIAKLHGSNLLIESEPGKGTTVGFSLEISEKEDLQNEKGKD